MGHPRSCVTAILAGTALAGLASLATACSSSDSDADNPSFLRIELIPASQGGPAPQAVLAEISNAASSTPLCINVTGKSGETTASFVLRRAPERDPTQRVYVKVTAFSSLSGQNNVGSGEEFACPSDFPAPVAAAQELSVDFCPGASRRIVFHVGAQCGCTDGGTGACDCEPGQTCSAGLSTMGNACAEGECCSSELSSACALEPVP